MREILFVTWTAQLLGVSRLPYEGIWESQPDFIRSFEIPRPTRNDILQSVSSRENLDEALKALTRGTDIDSELWFLFPSIWEMTFNVQCPELDTSDQINEHLLWEAQQYLHRDISEFHIQWNLIGDNEYRIVIIRKDIFNSVVDALKAAGFEKLHFGIEPAQGTEYHFSPKYDLNNPIDLEDAPDLSISQPKTGKPSVVFIFISVFALIIVSSFVFFIFRNGEIETVTESDYASTDPTPVIQAIPEIPTKSVDSVFVVKEESHSISDMFRGLSGSGENIKMIVITEVEVRIEMIIIQDLDKILQTIEDNKWFSQPQKVGTFIRDGKTVSVIQSLPNGFNDSSSHQDMSGWLKSAESIGLKTNGRSAFGEYKQALSLIELQWGGIFGFSKLYMAPANGRWTITVQ
ncbi:MAG: hypothetical protein HN356_14005 [Calditrichaeota bacterium]|jgi:hypothetical protein|nr:hypothetical protein [Calditrichota bacterium]